jgi:hypothetical protein
MLSAEEFDLRRCAREHLAASVCRVAAHWKQRAKIWVLKEGDSNTRYFHARASQRYRRNHIRLLELDGEVIVGHGEKATTLHSFYSNLLGHARTIS